MTHALVPGRVVGELTAFAFLAWAALLLPSARLPVVALGGLCAGRCFEVS